MQKLKEKNRFYNKYHQKNNRYFSIIGENNFTYFYILDGIRKVISTIKPGSRILDIGCGVGTIGFYLANKGFTVDGYDASSDAINIANEFKKYSGFKNIKFFHEDVQNIKIIEKYNCIICTEVIEHIENDKKMIKKIYALLKHGGILLLSTPSQNAPLHRLGFLKKFDREVGHLRRYESEPLLKLFDSSKFTVIRCNKVESILRNSMFTFSSMGFFIKFIKGPLIPLFHLFDRVLVRFSGESDLIITLQKK